MIANEVVAVSRNILRDDAADRALPARSVRQSATYPGHDRATSTRPSPDNTTTSDDVTRSRTDAALGAFSPRGYFVNIFRIHLGIRSRQTYPLQEGLR